MIKGVAITVLTLTMLGLLYLLFVAKPEDRKNVVETVGSAVEGSAEKLQSAAYGAVDSARSVHGGDGKKEVGDGPPPEPVQPDEEIAALGFIKRIRAERPDAVRTNASRRVTQLRLFNMEIQDTDLKAIGTMDELEVLLLNSTKISDRGMVQLINLKNLKELDVSSTKVTGRGMISLRGNKGLEKLSMAFNKVSDADGSVLGAFTSLKHLNLSETVMGDRGIVALRHLKKLKVLKLYNAPVTEKTLEQFERARPGLKIER